MTDTEAMMWTAERDPFLSSGMGSVFVLDEKPDFERLTTSMVNASHTVMRLRERVVEGIGIAPPRWETDEHFDIHNHLVPAKLAAPGTRRELFDLAASVFEEPFDTTKPLWKFVVVSGSGSRKKDAVKGAIIMKLHHAVSDGIGAVRLAEAYLDLERDPPATIRLDVPTPDAGSGGLDAAVADVGHVVKKQLDVARRAAAEVALWGADPDRAANVVREVVAVAKTVADQAVGEAVASNDGSALWSTRSASRTYEAFDLTLDDLKVAAKRLDGSINDVFVAGTVIAASRYHRARDAEVDTFNLSFIISTRKDDAAGGNSFAPIPFSVDARPRSLDEMFTDVQAAMADKREHAGTGAADSMELMAALANAMPAAIMTKAGRARASKIDWATSNLRGAPFPVFVAGAEITHMYPVGPLGGTAFNLTAMSYNGNFNFGLFVDPVAVDEPAELVEHLQSSYRDLIEGGT